MDTLRRPEVTFERDIELENLAMQIMLQVPADLGECLIISDKCTDIMRRRLEKAFAAGHLQHLRNEGNVVPMSTARFRLVSEGSSSEVSEPSQNRPAQAGKLSVG